MTIRFDMQLADTLACVKHYLKSDKGARKAMLWYRVLVPLIWAILLIPDVAQGRMNVAIVVVGVVTSGRMVVCSSGALSPFGAPAGEKSLRKTRK